MRSQPLANLAALVWVSARCRPALLSSAAKKEILQRLVALQQSDGGWSLTALGKGVWKRRDGSPFETRSDGYATALVVLALEDSGVQNGAFQSSLTHGLAWLRTNQNPTTGQWPAWSLNKKRDPDSDIGKFMSDAATGFAVLALSDPNAH